MSSSTKVKRNTNGAKISSATAVTQPVTGLAATTPARTIPFSFNPYTIIIISYMLDTNISTITILVLLLLIVNIITILLIPS